MFCVLFLKADGVVRTGGEQRAAAVVAEDREAAKASMRREEGFKGFDEETKGSPRSKQNDVEEDAQSRLFRLVLPLCFYRNRISPVFIFLSFLP